MPFQTFVSIDDVEGLMFDSKIIEATDENGLEIAMVVLRGGTH